MALDPFLTIQEAAEFLGFTPETLFILVTKGLAPRKIRGRGWRCFAKEDIKYFKKYLPQSPNDLLPSGTEKPLFGLHDDGRWWPLVLYEDALANGNTRYFDGKLCEAGHRVKCYTKKRECVACRQMKAVHCLPVATH